uniref:Uncharacterized protein n=1 Tax=Cucumis melo TaxID=3656 RepID=A0A9I9EEL1_CUCME
MTEHGRGRRSTPKLAALFITIFPLLYIWPFPFLHSTTRKWSIPDAEKDVGIKNIGNKGFPDAVNNASGDASGKQSFLTHHEGVGKNTSRKGASGAASGIGFFPTPQTSGKTFNERREFPFSRRILRDFPTPRHCVGKSPLKSFQFCILQNRNREGKRKEKPRSSSRFPSPFRSCSAAVRRRPPSPLSLAAVCRFRGFSDAVLVRIGKASRDAFLPTSFCTSGYPFPTYFAFSSTYLCIGSTPVSCSVPFPTMFHIWSIFIALWYWLLFSHHVSAAIFNDLGFLTLFAWSASSYDGIESTA